MEFPRSLECNDESRNHRSLSFHQAILRQPLHWLSRPEPLHDFSSTWSEILLNRDENADRSNAIPNPGCKESSCKKERGVSVYLEQWASLYLHLNLGVPKEQLLDPIDRHAH